MSFVLPEALRSSTPRLPFLWENKEQLVASSLEERISLRMAELDRHTGQVTIQVPPKPLGRPPKRTAALLPPAGNAAGGRITPARRAWVAKYDPRRALTDPDIDYSDVYRDFTWGDPATAIQEPWIDTLLMRGVLEVAPEVHFGDVVFAMRTQWLDSDTDSPWLRRRCLVGLWFVEAITSYPAWHGSSGPRIEYEIACQPIRRFDFPVPVEATSDQDHEFADAQAFRDRARRSFLGINSQEAVAVTRNCGLPVEVLTEPDPDRLTAIVANLDLGPPTTVRRRILEGARGAAHRKSVEASARDVAVAALNHEGFGVVSTEKQRGLGSDLWAKAIEHDNTETDIRVEVKGLSGKDPWAAHLTWSEIDAAQKGRGSNDWWLVIVTKALRKDRKAMWLTADQVAAIFVEERSGHYTADRKVAAQLGLSS